MIGQWDNSGVVFAILPKCIQQGSNPATYGAIPASHSYGDWIVDGTYGWAPVYSPGNNITGQIKYIGDPTPVGFKYDSSGFYQRLNSDPQIGYTGPSIVLNPPVSIPIDDAAEMTMIGWITPSQRDFDEQSNIFIQMDVNLNYLGTLGGMAFAGVDNPESFEFAYNGDYYNYDIAARTGHNAYPNVMRSVAIVKRQGVVVRSFTDGLPNDLFADISPSANPSYSPLGIGATWFIEGFPEGQPIPGYTLGPDSPFNGVIVYNRALSDVEVAHVNAMGPGLGGLFGLDRGNGTMLLSDKNTWISDVEGNWADATNWSYGIVPTASDDAAFNGEHTGRCIIGAGKSAKTLTVYSGYPKRALAALDQTITLYPDKSGYVVYAYDGFEIDGVLSIDVRPYNVPDNAILDFSGIYAIWDHSQPTTNSPQITLLYAETGGENTHYRFLGKLTGMGIGYSPINPHSKTRTISFMGAGVYEIDSILIYDVDGGTLIINIEAEEIKGRRGYITLAGPNLTFNAPNLQRVRIIANGQDFLYLGLAYLAYELQSNAAFQPYDIIYESIDSTPVEAWLLAYDSAGGEVPVRNIVCNLATGSNLTGAPLIYLNPTVMKLYGNLTMTSGQFMVDPYYGVTKLYFTGALQHVDIYNDQLVNMNATIPDQVIQFNTHGNIWKIDTYTPGDIGGTSGHPVTLEGLS